MFHPRPIFTFSGDIRHILPTGAVYIMTRCWEYSITSKRLCTHKISIVLDIVGYGLERRFPFLKAGSSCTRESISILKGCGAWKVIPFIILVEDLI